MDQPADGFDAQTGSVHDPEAIHLLESTPIGRLGFMADDGPIVLPVNFRWVDNAAVFRTLEGHMLASAADGRDVCFEVDEWDPQEKSGWSVIVRGTANEVTNWAEREQLEGIGLVPWAKEHWRPVWVRVDATDISLRKVNK